MDACPVKDTITPVSIKLSLHEDGTLPVSIMQQATGALQNSHVWNQILAMITANTYLFKTTSLHAQVLMRHASGSLVLTDMSKIKKGLSHHRPGSIKTAALLMYMEVSG